MTIKSKMLLKDSLALAFWCCICLTIFFERWNAITNLTFVASVVILFKMEVPQPKPQPFGMSLALIAIVICILGGAVACFLLEPEINWYFTYPDWTKVLTWVVCGFVAGFLFHRTYQDTKFSKKNTQ